MIVVQPNSGHLALSNWSIEAKAFLELRESTSVGRVVRAQDGDDDRPGDKGDQGDLATLTSKPKLKRPPMYKVIFLNDDYTPMEFVVVVLEKFFHMDREKATQIMLTVHTTGSAVVGIFPRDIAETKSELVNEYAQEHQYPLRSVVEMTD